MMPILSPPLLVLAVLALDLAVGPLRSRIRLFPGVPVLLARLALGLSWRLYRPRRGLRALRFRGALMVVWLAGFAALAGLGLAHVVAVLPAPYGTLLEAFVLWSCLRIARPLERLWQGGRALRRGKSGEGSSAIEQTAVSFVHFVAVPVFWYLVAGLPGLFVAAAGWAVERAASSRNRGKKFGGFATRFQRVLSWIPSRIAEAIWALAALTVPRGRPVAALLQGWRYAGAGDLAPIAAFAGGLGVAVPGPRKRAGPVWLGSGTARIGPRDIARAMWLYFAALLILGGILAFLGPIWP